MAEVERKIPGNGFSPEEKLLLPGDANKLVDPEDSITTTKEEEWVTKKKIELTTRRQIETRVKRQVVLEDGKVVEDSGPMVTTNTTEDTQKQEHSQTEHRTLGDDGSSENRIAVSNLPNRVKEVQEKTVRSREETEERTETEDVRHLGDMSDEGYMTAIKSGSDDVRQALEVSNRKELIKSSPKVIHQSMKIKKYIDTEDMTQVSQVQPGGKIINETKTTRLHEELGNYNISDDDSTNSQDFYETTKKENLQKYRKTKKQDLTEYLVHGQKIGEKLHFQEETSEAERSGDHFDPNENVSSRLERIRMRSQNRKLPLESARSDHKDPLRKKTSNFDEEEETRKEETSKWLEYHFGSESTKSSKGSVEDLDDIVPAKQNSFINVTMKSQPLKRNSKPRHASSSEEERAVRNFGAINKNRSPSPKSSYFQGIAHWSERRDEDRLDAVPRPSPVHRNSPSSRVFLTKTSVQSRPHSNRGQLNGTPPPSKAEIEGYGSFVRVENVPERQLINEKRFRPISSVQSDVSDTFSNDKIRQSHLSRVDGRDVNGHGTRDFEARIRIETPPVSDPESKADEARMATPKGEEAAALRPPSSKKFYQRTRFAADIPPPPQPKQSHVKQKSKIGESFRKLVGKFRSSSSDRKSKKKSKSNESRSPSPAENTYQNYNSLDHYGSLVTGSGEEVEEPVAPSRTRSGLRVQPRHTGEGDKSVQKYYLGEDPFSGSIYGREKEYEERASPTRSGKDRGRIAADEESDFKSRTLGRFSKSTSRLQNSVYRPDSYSQDGRAVQTLPRKRPDEKMKSKTVGGQEIPKDAYLHESDDREFADDFQGSRADEPKSHARSLINVSFVNQAHPQSYANEALRPRTEFSWQGPAKPARTYRSNLSRSQSFNVQPGQRNYANPFKSNPHLHRLEEPPPPLESPSMIFRWRQSSNCLDEKDSSVFEAKETRKSDGRMRDSYENNRGNGPDEPRRINWNLHGTTPIDSDRATDPFRGHRFARPNQMRPRDGSRVRTESEDFSEAARIRSRSEDLLNPSEASTANAFSKKSILSNDGYSLGATENTEARDRIWCDSSPTGVVIKVRNARN